MSNYYRQEKHPKDLVQNYVTPTHQPQKFQNLAWSIFSKPRIEMFKDRSNLRHMPILCLKSQN